MSFVGRSVPRLEDRPLVTGRGRFAADVGVSAYAAHAGRAFGISRMAASCRSIRQRGAGAAGRRRGLDLRRRRRHSADRFPADPHRGIWRPTARPSWRGSGCAMWAIRSPPCSRPMPYLAEDAADLVHSRDRGAAGHSRRQRSARRVRGWPLDRAGDRGEVLRRRRRGVPRRACGGGARPRDRAAFRRPDGNARRDRPLRRRQRRAWRCTAPPRCRTGTATISPACSGRDPSTVHLIEGHVGGGFGIRGELYPEDVLVCARGAAARPAGEMDRGPARAPDRRQPFAPAASQVRAAVDGTGRILAIDDEFFHDQGGYVRTHAATVPDLTAAMLPGPYRVPAYRAARPCAAHQQDAGRHLPGARAGTRARSCASA